MTLTNRLIEDEWDETKDRLFNRPPYVERFSNLTVCRPTQEWRETFHSRYRYLVLHSAFSHNAFNTLDGLTRWANERGLQLPHIPDGDGHFVGRIDGEYGTAMYLNSEAFYKLNGDLIRVLSNARYTLGIVTADETGIRVVNYLNPNVKDRPVFDYFVSEGMYR